MALTLQPVSREQDARHSSIIALVVTNLLGDIKGESFGDSSSEMMTEVHRLISWPDTKCYLYNTDNNGERLGDWFAMITKDGYYDGKEG